MARPTRTIWYSWCYDCVFVLNDKATLDAGWVTRLYIVIPSVTLLRDCSVSESNSDHATVTLEDIPSMYLFACLRAERACAFAWTRVLQVVSAFLQRIFGRETDGARMMLTAALSRAAFMQQPTRLLFGRTPGPYQPGRTRTDGQGNIPNGNGGPPATRRSGGCPEC